MFDIENLNMLEDQWQEPEKFIPERFDVNSKYYLTPGGQRRKPATYIPFVGGRRVCLGKTFAEIMSKLVGASMLALFDFEVVDKEILKDKVHLNFQTVNLPEIKMKIKLNQ